MCQGVLPNALLLCAVGFSLQAPTPDAIVHLNERQITLFKDGSMELVTTREIEILTPQGLAVFARHVLALNDDLEKLQNVTFEKLDDGHWKPASLPQHEEVIRQRGYGLLYPASVLSFPPLKPGDRFRFSVEVERQAEIITGQVFAVLVTQDLRPVHKSRMKITLPFNRKLYYQWLSEGRVVADSRKSDAMPAQYKPQIERQEKDATYTFLVGERQPVVASEDAAYRAERLVVSSVADWAVVGDWFREQYDKRITAEIEGIKNLVDQSAELQPEQAIGQAFGFAARRIGYFSKHAGLSALVPARLA